MNVATWNALHDGRLIAAEGTVPGDLRLSVAITYLCGHLPTHSEHLTITLVECQRFEYEPHEGPAVVDPMVVSALGLELLSAELSNDRINVECADGSYGGQLVLQYESAEVATAEGRTL